MKISITVTLDVDPEAWHQEYGTAQTLADVRRDVRSWFTTAVHALAANENGVRSAEVKK
jgi:hypothetical protein